MKHSTHKNPQTKAVLAIAAMALIYASIGIPVRFLTLHFTLLQQLYLWLFASTVLSFLFFHKNIRLTAIRHTTGKDAVIVIYRALSFYSIGYYLYSIGISTTKYGNVAMIYAFPMFAVLGIIFLKEKLSLSKTITIIGATIGALLIGVKDLTDISFGSGEFVTLASTFFFSSTLVARKWQSNKLNNFEITIMMFLVASVTTFLWSLTIGEKLPQFQWNPLVFSAIFAVAIMNTFALLFTNYGYEKLDILVGGTISYLDTVFGVLVSILLYREIPNLKEALGGILILISALSANTFAQKSSDS